MKRILLKNVYDAFEYVMDHYYPNGLEELAARNDTYAVISIQDTHTDGFGFVFTKSKACKDVLTLYFDDVEREVKGAKAFSIDDASRIIEFVDKNKDVDTLLVHCYGGESRSRAVAGFIREYLGKDGSVFLNTGHPNKLVYETLKKAVK